MAMTSKLTQDEKDQVAELYSSGEYTQDEVANQFCVSRRTIQRALNEKGVLHYREKAPRKVSEEEEAILHLVRSKGLDYAALTTALGLPALTKENVQRYLTQMDSAGFANMITLVGYRRVVDMAQRQREEEAKQRAYKEATDA